LGDDFSPARRLNESSSLPTCGLTGYQACREAIDVDIAPIPGSKPATKPAALSGPPVPHRGGEAGPGSGYATQLTGCWWSDRCRAVRDRMRTLLHSPFQAASLGSDRRMECETGARFPAAGPRGQRAGLCIAQYVHGCIGSPARDMPPLQSRPWITCSRLQGRSAHATSTSNLEVYRRTSPPVSYCLKTVGRQEKRRRSPARAQHGYGIVLMSETELQLCLGPHLGKRRTQLQCLHIQARFCCAEQGLKPPDRIGRGARRLIA